MKLKLKSARMNGHDPYLYLKDVLTRLPTHKNSQIDELLPHLWRPACMPPAPPPADTPVPNQP